MDGVEGGKYVHERGQNHAVVSREESMNTYNTKYDLRTLLLLNLTIFHLESLGSRIIATLVCVKPAGPPKSSAERVTLSTSLNPRLW